MAHHFYWHNPSSAYHIRISHTAQARKRLFFSETANFRRGINLDWTKKNLISLNVWRTGTKNGIATSLLSAGWNIHRSWLAKLREIWHFPSSWTASELPRSFGYSGHLIPCTLQLFLDVLSKILVFVGLLWFFVFFPVEGIKVPGNLFYCQAERSD